MNILDNVCMYTIPYASKYLDASPTIILLSFELHFEIKEFYFIFNNFHFTLRFHFYIFTKKIHSFYILIST